VHHRAVGVVARGGRQMISSFRAETERPLRASDNRESLRSTFAKKHA
jgi:hypothetical protein